MIKVKIITLGKLKEAYLRDASAEYVKRLISYAKVEVVELEPVRLPENPSDAQVENALQTEAAMIERKIDDKAFVTALCIEGRSLSSEEFSKTLFDRIDAGSGSLVFIIGSSYGLHERIKQSADLKLSFSKMTFPHQLFRVMLLEQLYRGFKIREGARYHK